MIPSHPPPHLAALVAEQEERDTEKLKKAKAIRFLSQCIVCNKRPKEGVCHDMLALKDPELWKCEVAE